MRQDVPEKRLSPALPQLETIIHLANRKRYMEALEAASVHKDIRPFAGYVLEEMQAAVIAGSEEP